MSAVYGCIPDLVDPVNERRFRVARPRAFPDHYTLQEYRGPILDQGWLGSCVWHGLTSVARHYMRKRGIYDFQGSRLAGYYRSRAREGTLASDVGCMIQTGIAVLQEFGMGHEDLFPYEAERWAELPPQEIWDDAMQYRALSPRRVDTSDEAVKTAVMAGHPVIIGVTVYQSFEGPETARTGIVTMPEPGEIALGGHCMYVDTFGERGGIDVVNSYGEGWGDNGTCHLPPGYIDKFGADLWCIDLFGSQAEKDAGVA